VFRLRPSVSVWIVFSEQIYCPSSDDTDYSWGSKDVLDPICLNLIFLFDLKAFESVSLWLSPYPIWLSSNYWYLLNNYKIYPYSYASSLPLYWEIIFEISFRLFFNEKVDKISPILL
jgi:hypothetical protein